MTAATEALHLTDSAAETIWSLMEEEGNHALKLRVFVQGGGCSGLQYGFQFEDVANDDDTVIEKSLTRADGSTVTVTVLVDPMSLQYLADAEIDYRDDINGATFIIRNPNADTSCGCGSSFSVKE